MVNTRRRRQARSMAVVLCLTVFWFGFPSANASEKSTERVPFTVRASIELEHVVRQSMELHASLQANPIAAQAVASPSYAHFVVQTRKGLVDENVLEDTLWMVSREDIAGILNSRTAGSAVKPRALHSRRAASERGIISNVQWLSAKELGFLASDDRGIRQAFAIEIGKQRLRQLTVSKTDVTAFTAMGRSVLYYARTAEAAPQVVSIATAEADLGGIIDPSTLSEAFPRVDLFVKVGEGEAVSIASPPIRLLPNFQSLWISPDERFAVAMQPAMAWPNHWEDYQLPHTGRLQYSRIRATADGTSLALLNRIQYRLIDLGSRVSGALIDAPTGFLSLNFTPAHAFWMNDSKSVIVSNTFLPLTEAVGAAREQRAKRPAIAEIQLFPRKVTPIVWEPAAIEPPDGGRETVQNPIVAVDLIQDRLIVHAASQNGSILTIDPKAVRSRQYAKVAGRWSLFPASSRRDEKREFSLHVSQELNARPKIFVSGGRCQCSKELWDPNPSADRYSFGHAQVLTWDDSKGIAWQAGLILPPNYEVGRRYPLVIQTHGFQSDEFLSDGPQGTTTAFAAQPLANSGFIVLQLEDNSSAETGDTRQSSAFAEGMRSAIDKLDKEGMIDAARVGAIGWSISGSYVVRLMSEHPEALAAAIVSDAVQFGYLPYLFMVNVPSAMRAAFDASAGSEAAIRDPAAMIALDPTHKWAHYAPPVRLEAISSGSVIGMWETYALLRYAKRAVDFVYYPTGSHSLQKPAERMASQQGAVDWFRFWLQNYEDGEPEKRLQYKFWRDLRARYQAK